MSSFYLFLPFFRKLHSNRKGLAERIEKNWDFEIYNYRASNLFSPFSQTQKYQIIPLRTYSDIFSLKKKIACRSGIRARSVWDSRCGEKNEKLFKAMGVADLYEKWFSLNFHNFNDKWSFRYTVVKNWPRRSVLIEEKSAREKK